MNLEQQSDAVRKRNGSKLQKFEDTREKPPSYQADYPSISEPSLLKETSVSISSTFVQILLKPDEERSCLKFIICFPKHRY